MCIRDSNAEQAYLKGLEKKIRAVEHRSILNEFGLAVFVVSASLVLKLGIATVALVGAVLLMQGSLSVLTFFMFLLVAVSYTHLDVYKRQGKHRLFLNILLFGKLHEGYRQR